MFGLGDRARSAFPREEGPHASGVLLDKLGHAERPPGAMMTRPTPPSSPNGYCRRGFGKPSDGDISGPFIDIVGKLPSVLSTTPDSSLHASASIEPFIGQRLRSPSATGCPHQPGRHASPSPGILATPPRAWEVSPRQHMHLDRPPQSPAPDRRFVA